MLLQASALLHSGSCGDIAGKFYDKQELVEIQMKRGEAMFEKLSFRIANRSLEKVFEVQVSCSSTRI